MAITSFSERKNQYPSLVLFCAAILAVVETSAGLRNDLFRQDSSDLACLNLHRAMFHIDR